MDLNKTILDTFISKSKTKDQNDFKTFFVSIYLQIHELQDTRSKGYIDHDFINKSQEKEMFDIIFTFAFGNQSIKNVFIWNYFFLCIFKC